MPRVLIATDQPILAKGLESVLTAGGIEITDICADISELYESLRRSRPDVAILDMPVLPSATVIRDLQRLAPTCELVLWPRLTPSDSPAGLVDAIKRMAHSPAPAREFSPSALVNRSCSASERELMALVGYGLSNEEIAAERGADRSTIKRQLRDLADRLGAEDRYELAIFGLSTLREHQCEGRI